MGTLIHKIKYFSNGQQIGNALWCGPVEGIIEIAKTTMPRKGADWPALWRSILTLTSGLEGPIPKGSQGRKPTNLQI
jgi:hypothetical protein